ncbi:MAG: cytochrome c biogenesis CcdA family protein [Arachnia sp.]
MIGYGGAFLGGVAAILSPCAALLLPAFFAYAFGEDRAKLVGRTGLFYLGLLVALVPLGLGAGALGSLVTVHRGELAAVGGTVLIVFGLVQALGISLRVPGVERRGDPRGAAGAVLLGATYGLAGACTGPLLGAVLAVAAVGGDPVYGAVLLALFGLGMVLPLLVLAWLWDRLRLGERARPRELHLGPFTTTWFQVISGVLFAAIGVLFLTTDATAALGGLLDASAQARVEGRLRAIADGVPDLAVVGVLALLVAVALWRWLRRRA